MVVEINPIQTFIISPHLKLPAVLNSSVLVGNGFLNRFSAFNHCHESAHIFFNQFMPFFIDPIGFRQAFPFRVIKLRLKRPAGFNPFNKLTELSDLWKVRWILTGKRFDCSQCRYCDLVGSKVLKPR